MWPLEAPLNILLYAVTPAVTLRNLEAFVGGEVGLLQGSNRWGQKAHFRGSVGVKTRSGGMVLTLGSQPLPQAPCFRGPLVG